MSDDHTLLTRQGFLSHGALLGGSLLLDSGPLAGSGPSSEKPPTAIVANDMPRYGGRLGIVSRITTRTASLTLMSWKASTSRIRYHGWRRCAPDRSIWPT